MPLQKRAEAAGRGLRVAAEALDGVRQLLVSLCQQRSDQQPQGSEEEVERPEPRLSRLLTCLEMCGGANAALAKSFLPEDASDEHRFLSVFVAAAVAGRVQTELTILRRCLEQRPPDLSGAEVQADSTLQRILMAAVSLAVDVPIYAREVGARVALLDLDRRFLARLTAGSAGLLERVAQRAGIDVPASLFQRLASQIDSASSPSDLQRRQQQQQQQQTGVQPEAGGEAAGRAGQGLVAPAQSSSQPVGGTAGGTAGSTAGSTAGGGQYAAALVRLLQEAEERLKREEDSAIDTAAAPLLGRLLAGPEGTTETDVVPAETVLDRLLSALPAQRGVLTRAALSRCFEVAAERLQASGFQLGTRQPGSLPTIFQAMASTVRANHSVHVMHALSELLTEAATIAAAMPPEDPEWGHVASLFAGQLLPARNQYLQRALGGRLLPDGPAAALRLCGSAVAAAFSNRTPWAQLRVELGREAAQEAALLGTLRVDPADVAQATAGGQAPAPVQMHELLEDVEADLSRLLAHSPTGDGGGPGATLDLSHLRASGDHQAAALVVQTVCERALLRGDAAAADELVAASRTLREAGW